MRDYLRSLVSCGDIRLAMDCLRPILVKSKHLDSLIYLSVRYDILISSGERDELEMADITDKFLMLLDLIRFD